MGDLTPVRVGTAMRCLILVCDKNRTHRTHTSDSAPGPMYGGYLDSFGDEDTTSR